MGIITTLKEKVSDHHEQQRESVDELQTHNDGHDVRKSDAANWVAKGQGGERSDDHGIRAGSLTADNTASAMSDPTVAEAVAKDEGRVGGGSR
ncbi:hypothetical protein OHC33_010695 [Knufia fluminis]|uniref:Uncharacterized protein n=1 Tax=Knufia fluminis TaxID=191047 RepID=A0AAN8I3D9_9EURO|nr:hypothetical protein OHC33_010695 [Knufia fluminis]